MVHGLLTVCGHTLTNIILMGSILHLLLLHYCPNVSTVWALRDFLIHMLNFCVVTLSLNSISGSSHPLFLAVNNFFGG